VDFIGIMSSVNLLFEPHVGSIARRDMLIEFIKAELYHGFALGLSETYAPTMKRIEVLIEEHRAQVRENPLAVSRLKNAVPSVSSFHTPLPLEEAWRRYDNKYCVSARRTVAPSFNEVRHTLNLAQVMALAPEIEMACFDGDQTLYSDGGNFANKELASVLIMLMENNVKVVLITAAGYGFDGSKYEIRVRGLLDAMVMAELSEEVMGRFFVMGGECNYLLRCDASGHLVKVSDAEWEVSRLPLCHMP
jgi:IMP and pyridine-specific 5'-nucleotidase